MNRPRGLSGADSAGRERFDRTLAAVASRPVRVVLERVRVGAGDARIAEALERVPALVEESHRDLNSQSVFESRPALAHRLPVRASRRPAMDAPAGRREEILPSAR
jgi:hypothetical protein